MGGGYQFIGNIKQTLVERWNGSSWEIRPSPNAGSSDNTLTAVAALSANDVWAVGDYLDASGVARTLTEHWNGSAWSIVSSPNNSTDDNVLLAVSGNPATGNLRAVGYYIWVGGISEPLIEHWNGSTWVIESVPSQGGGDNSLFGVVIAATNNIWAVGHYVNTASGNTRTLIEHWDGSAWTIVSSPNQPGDNTLFAVDSVSTNDVWAVGSSYSGIVQHADRALEWLDLEHRIKPQSGFRQQ